jgi:hypothetical protein
MVVTSRKCGTFDKVSGSSLNNAAHINGKAAFLAPEIRTSPLSGFPPCKTSLSTGLLPFLRRKCPHGEGVNLFSHPVTQGLIDKLVPLDPALSAKGIADNQRLEMLSVSRDLQFNAGQPLFYIGSQFLWSDHFLDDLIRFGSQCLNL